MRIPLLRREPATYVKLRRLGYSINTIAKAFGRSNSIIHRILRANGLTRNDLRKLPHHIRQLAAQNQRLGIIRYLKFWEAWTLGEGEIPP